MSEGTKRLLIVEDDEALSRGIALALQNAQTGFVQARTLAEARGALAGGTFDLLLLDLNLPDGNGLDLLKSLRAQPRYAALPILLLTANDMETDIVAGLELGADDYITKPFSLMVLRARVNARLRGRETPAAPAVFAFEDFYFDFARMVFLKAGAPVELSKTEQRLLRCLVENRGQTLPRGTLVDRVWTDGAAYVDENALSVTIKRLRDKLEDDPAKPRCIKTVYGIGYSWAVEQ